MTPWTNTMKLSLWGVSKSELKLYSQMLLCDVKRKAQCFACMCVSSLLNFTKKFNHSLPQHLV